MSVGQLKNIDIGGAQDDLENNKHIKKALRDYSDHDSDYNDIDVEEEDDVTFASSYDEEDDRYDSDSDGEGRANLDNTRMTV